MNAFIALVYKDLVLYFSNRRAVLTTVLAPIAIAAFFGFIFNTNPKDPGKIPLAITDLDHSALSATIITSLSADKALSVEPLDEADANSRVQHGKVRAAILIPPDFGLMAARALTGAGPKPAVTIHYDPSQAMVLPMVEGMLAQYVMQGVGRAIFESAPARTGAAPGVVLQTPFENHAVETTSGGQTKYNSYSHSFAGMGVQFVLFMGIELGVGVLLARRLGLWKRLRAAPISKSLLLSSRVVSGALTAFILLMLIYAAAMLFFGVRVEGSLLGFFGVAAAFAFLTSTFGLLIAALGRTPEATRGLAVLATLLMVMLGGAWVPTFIFPPWLQQISEFVPTRWAIDGLDGMTWRGLGLQEALLPIAVTLGFSVVFAVIALARFDWEE